MTGWVLEQRIISLDVEASLSILFCSCPLGLPSVMNLNCLLTEKRVAHFSTALSHKVSREPSHACSILDDTPNPIWLEVHFFALLHPLLLLVCVIACVHVCAGRHVQICVGAGSYVGVCHVFAVISVSCRVSQDLRYTVCSACQAQLRLHSNSQHCATVGKEKK